MQFSPKLSRDGFFAKFWCWFYLTKPYKLPNSFCPFFWGSLIAFVLSIPWFIIRIPEHISMLVTNTVVWFKNRNKTEDEKEEYDWNALTNNMILTFLNNCLGHIILFLVGYYVYSLTVLARWGFDTEIGKFSFVATVIGSLSAFFIFFFKYLKNRAIEKRKQKYERRWDYYMRNGRYPEEEKLETPKIVKELQNFMSLVAELINGLGKYCPRIEWK